MSNGEPKSLWTLGASGRSGVSPVRNSPNPEPSEHGSISQPEEELTNEAPAQQEPTAPPSPAQATEPTTSSAPEQQAQPVTSTTTGGGSQRHQQPRSLKPQPWWLTQPHRPPLPTPLPCTQPTPPPKPKAVPEPSFHQPHPKVYHMDKNKQTHFLQPSDDETDPTASASTGTALPPATRPTRPPGSDIWWVAEPILKTTSPRHQPKRAGTGWVSWDGSWWRNYWHTHGDTVPVEATPEEYTYSHDPAFWYNSRIWVHPYRPEHEAFLKGPQPKPSAAFQGPSSHAYAGTFPPANPAFSPTVEFKWGEPSEPPAPGFDVPIQTKPSSHYILRKEQQAVAQLQQGYPLWIRGRWKWALRTAMNSRGNPMFGYYDDRNRMCCAEPCGTQPECPHDSLAVNTLMVKATLSAAAAMSRKVMASSLGRSEPNARSSLLALPAIYLFSLPSLLESTANRALLKRVS